MISQRTVMLSIDGGRAIEYSTTEQLYFVSSIFGVQTRIGVIHQWSLHGRSGSKPVTYGNMKNNSFASHFRGVAQPG